MVAIVSAMSEFEFFISSTCIFYLFTLIHMEMLMYFPFGGNIGHSSEKVEEFCNVLVQKCLTEVIGTILMLEWVLC